MPWVEVVWSRAVLIRRLYGPGHVGEFNPHDVGNLPRVLDTHLTGARRALPANPNDLENPGFFPPQGLYFHLHPHLERNTRLQLRAKLTDRYNLGVLRKGLAVGQHA